MSHTKGPWKVEEFQRVIEVASGTDSIAEVRPTHEMRDSGLATKDDVERGRANARLIAAAPELQDTVIELLKVAGACLRTLALTDEKFITVFDMELNREGVEDGFGVRARKVLAKSKGETYEPVMPVAPRAKATGGAQ